MMLRRLLVVLPLVLMALVGCGASSREAKDPGPIDIATVDPVTDVDGGASRMRSSETAPLMLAMMPKDVACVYTNPASHKISLRASTDETADLVSIGPTGMAVRLVVTPKAAQFVELTGIRLRARGYPTTNELLAVRDIPFGELVVLPRGQSAHPVGVAQKRLLVDAPTIEGLHFVTPLAPAEIPCDALTLEELAYEPHSDGVIGSVQLGRKTYELYATPGGPVVATLTAPTEGPGRELQIIGKQRGFLHVQLTDGRGRLDAWIKDAGLKVRSLAQMLDHVQPSVAIPMNGLSLNGASSSGEPLDPGVAQDSLRKAVHCKDSITLLASRIATGPKRVPLLVLKDVDLRYGDQHGDYATVVVMSPREISAAFGATLEARLSDLEACTAP